MYSFNVFIKINYLRFQKAKTEEQIKTKIERDNKNESIKQYKKMDKINKAKSWFFEINQ